MGEGNRPLFSMKILILAAIPLLVLPIFFAQGQTECTDSDGGLDFYVKGAVTKEGTTIEDYCEPNNILNEMFCDGDEMGEVKHQCIVCEDGACINPCEGKICGEPCAESGICDSDGNCFPEGGCLLTCEEPDPGFGNVRVWNDSDCGRRGSYKCGKSHICGNSLTDCIEGGNSIEITGQWDSYTPPPYYLDVGDMFEITLTWVSGGPGSKVLTECSVKKPDGTTIYLNNWGSGDVTFSYEMGTKGVIGTWTVDYCGLWSDFEQNGGWLLHFDGTDHTFKVGMD